MACLHVKELAIISKRAKVRHDDIRLGCRPGAAVALPKEKPAVDEALRGAIVVCVANRPPEAAGALPKSPPAALHEMLQPTSSHAEHQLLCTI